MLLKTKPGEILLHKRVCPSCLSKDFGRNLGVNSLQHKRVYYIQLKPSEKGCLDCECSILGRVNITRRRKTPRPGEKTPRYTNTCQAIRTLRIRYSNSAVERAEEKCCMKSLERSGHYTRRTSVLKRTAVRS